MSRTLEPEELMDRDHLARLLRRWPGMITKYATLDSMPVAEGGGHGRQARYLPSACVAWLLAQAEAKAAPAGALNPASERARRDHHQAELAAQLYRRRSGEVIEVAEVRHVLSTLVVAARARLLRMPSALAAQCAHEADPAAVQALLDGEVRAALTELSSWQPPADPTTPKRKRRTPTT